MTHENARKQQEYYDGFSFQQGEIIKKNGFLKENGISIFIYT
jgi:hypothetical protein